MARNALCTQVIDKTSSTSRKALSLIHICCICERLRDDTGPSVDRERWVTLKTYRKTHDMNPANNLLTHTYCADCFPQVMDRIRERFRATPVGFLFD